MAASVETVLTGSLLLAIPLAVLAGLVSFVSPCVLPLVPGYLSYVTGLAGTDMDDPRKGRVLAGTLLFIGGFTVVFVSFGTLFGGLGSVLLDYQSALTRVLGVFVIVLGLSFIGLIPGLQRESRLHLRPAVGLAGAPLLGVVFGLGWSPCIGPTLAVVQALAFTEASAARGALLTAMYCVGLGVPFILMALGYRRATGAVSWIRRHRRGVTVTGGVFLVAIGVLLVTGLWDQMMITMRIWAAGFTPSV